MLMCVFLEPQCAPFVLHRKVLCPIWMTCVFVFTMAVSDFATNPFVTKNGRIVLSRLTCAPLHCYVWVILPFVFRWLGYLSHFQFDTTVKPPMWPNDAHLMIMRFLVSEMAPPRRICIDSRLPSNAHERLSKATPFLFLRYPSWPAGAKKETRTC